ncbi:MAG: hypothetical protein E6K74_12485 [Candidatus Eisenbacteria bacterium]|uniref:Uncharacterized protein n=1 Tax=Eiseniibacteriota bacterium TaxID=2212470 RepID=A0A538SLT7_UNCEI|nr:MAG: hypothetical protein E6K74_12485 [Candidatus Eisenbacteria bacterium]
MVGKGIWGGVLVSPLIGILVGLVAARLRKLPASAVILQSAVGFLWGLTFMGYIVVLWPLSYLNCWLIWKQADAPSEPIGSGGNP